MDRMKRIPVREQAPEVRAHNFDEVCFGYNEEEALLEASRCLDCKVPRCMQKCPVSIKIPRFIEQIRNRNFAAAAEIISQDSSLPAICGRVCPQETQCEGSCVLGVKGEPIAIGKLERFVADWSRDNNVKVTRTAPFNGKRVAIVGSGPSALACASDLARLGYDVTIFEVLHKAGGVLQYGIPEFRLPKLDESDRNGMVILKKADLLENYTIEDYGFSFAAISRARSGAASITSAEHQRSAPYSDSAGP